MKRPRFQNKQISVKIVGPGRKRAACLVHTSELQLSIFVSLKRARQRALKSDRLSGHISESTGGDIFWHSKASINLVPRSHSVIGNVRSGKVRQYTIFHWLLKKGCGNAIYAPIGLFRGALNEGLVFASSCAVLNKCQLCGGKFFFPTPEKLYS